ncbi:MAG: hypothetical protein ACR2LN_05545 [Candidatus Levyibacteriota bacterium]
MNFANLPIIFLRFWFFESPLALLQFFLSLNGSFFQLFSLPLLLRTFFKPLKNEYRQGLVGFSIGMGIVVKSVLIVADLAMLFLLLVFEVSVFVAYFLFPFATFFLLFL